MMNNAWVFDFAQYSVWVPARTLSGARKRLAPYNLGTANGIHQVAIPFELYRDSVAAEVVHIDEFGGADA